MLIDAYLTSESHLSAIATGAALNNVDLLCAAWQEDTAVSGVIGGCYFVLAHLERSGFPRRAPLGVQRHGCSDIPSVNRELHGATDLPCGRSSHR
jgi:hypothetical protein